MYFLPGLLRRLPNWSLSKDLHSLLRSRFQVRADDIRAGDVVQQIFSDLGRAAGDSWREIFLLISIDFVRVQPAVRLARKLELAAEE